MAKKIEAKEIESVQDDVSVNTKTGDVIDNTTGEVLTEATPITNVPAEIKSTTALSAAGMDRRAIVAAALAGTLTVQGKTVKAVKTVTRPTLSMDGADAECMIRIETAIFKGKKVTVPRKSKKKLESGEEVTVDEGSFTSNPDMIIVRDLLDGEVPSYVEKQMVLATTLKNQILEAYPKDGYVGKCFAIQKYKKEGKSYGSFNIVEIEWPMEIIDMPMHDVSGMMGNADDDKKE